MRRRSSKNSTRSVPDAAEKAWHDELRRYGCVITGVTPEIHHVIGGSARINKRHVGEKFVLPLCTEVHKEIDHGKDAWCESYFGFAFVGVYDAEKFLFYQMVSDLGWPFEAEDLEAILSFTHR